MLQFSLLASLAHRTAFKSLLEDWFQLLETATHWFFLTVNTWCWYFTSLNYFLLQLWSHLVVLQIFWLLVEGICSHLPAVLCVSLGIFISLFRRNLSKLIFFFCYQTSFIPLYNHRTLVFKPATSGFILWIPLAFSPWFTRCNNLLCWSEKPSAWALIPLTSLFSAPLHSHVATQISWE